MTKVISSNRILYNRSKTENSYNKKSSKSKKNKVIKKYIKFYSDYKNNIFCTPKLRYKFIKLYYYLYKNNKSYYFIKRCNFYGYLVSGGSRNLTDLFNKIKIINSNQQELIYSKFNDYTKWNNIIKTNDGKQIIIYFLKNFFVDKKEFDNCNKNIINNYYINKHNILFSLIENNFYDFSISNYSTFVCQEYLFLTNSLYALKFIINNVLLFALNKNSSFVLKQAIDVYMSDELINIVIDNSELICKNQFSSTIMEHILENFREISHYKFYKKFSESILGKYKIYLILCLLLINFLYLLCYNRIY